jgi:hypothetical protein
MAEKRHNIDTIAKILLDKIQDLDKNAKRIENIVNEATSATIKVDLKETREIYSERKKQEGQFLADLRDSDRKTQSRLPNWMFPVVMVLVTVLVGFMVYTWDKAEDYTKMKTERDFYKARYENLKE